MTAFHATVTWLYRLGCILPWLIFSLLAPALAQVPTAIMPDGSLGTTVSQNGAFHIITGGTIRGPNQFHSFDRFDVGTADTARFTGPASVTNILSRVTGGAASMIDGTLQSDIAGANLYLLNPSGVMFGPNAQLDMTGSFYVSTADVVRLEDGGAFYADRATDSMLGMADPVAFGFLRENPSGIRIDESGLVVSTGQTLSLVGGEIHIIGGQAGILSATSGRVQIVSVGSAGEAVFGSSSIDVSTFDQLGQITLSNLTYIDASSDVGGTVVIRGGQLRIDQSGLFADAWGDRADARLGIDIDVTGDVVLDNEGVIRSEGSGEGAGGDIVLKAGRLVLRNSALIDASTSGAGQAGRVTITTQGTISISGLSQIASNTFGTGRSGRVTIVAQGPISITGRADAKLLDSSGLFSGTAGNGDAAGVFVSTPSLTLDGSVIVTGTEASGNGGPMALEVGTLTLTQSSVLEAGGERAGNAGAIQISATGAVVISASDVRSNSERIGNAGPISLSAQSLQIIDGSVIGTVADGGGQGGKIRIHVSGDVIVSGFPGELITERSRIVSETTDTGSSGDIEMQVGSLIVTDGAVISNTTLGTGDAGDIVIRARDMVSISGRDNVALNAQSGLFNATLGSGAAGLLTITAPTLALENRGVIVAGTVGAGEGGDLEVEVETLTLTGGAQMITDSSPSAVDFVLVRESLNLDLEALFPNRDQPGGDIAIRANHIELSDRAEVSALSTTTGMAGRINITAMDTFMMRQGSRVTAETTQADGGDISLTGRSEVRLRDSRITTSIAGGMGDGGDITIDPKFVILQGQSQIIANAFEGTGGAIQITADAFLIDVENSVVSASSTFGIDGEVNIDAITDLSGTLTVLPENFVQASVLLRQRCVRRLRGGEVSTFVVIDRDRHPIDPSTVLPSPPYVAPETANRALQMETSRPWASAPRIGHFGVNEARRFQAQGWQPDLSQVELGLACGKL